MVKPADTWLLPDGVQDVLPPEARRLEGLRRRLLDLYARWGYELVFPPLMEYLESLLTGSGHDLELMTFKITDQLSGRMMGVRADITPQVARIDAHCRPLEQPARYCYAGTILHTRPEGLAASRCPIQIGAELYGHAGVESDLEILRLMLATLASAGVGSLHIDLGHVGIYRALVADAGLTVADEARLFDIFQRKAVAELGDFLAERVADPARRERLARLMRLSGDDRVLAEARVLLAEAPAEARAALAALEQVAAELAVSHPEARRYFDCAELRGYHYHTGLVFAAYADGAREALAKGGRYDHVGEAFGRARPATGFSADLRALLAFLPSAADEERILAPVDSDPALRQRIADLRADGRCVVQLLPGQREPLGITARLVRQAETWVVATN